MKIQEAWLGMSNESSSATARLMKTKRKTRSAARWLECGHPGLPNNLKDGKCGTCQVASEFDELAKLNSNSAMKRICRRLAKYFRSGEVVYDANGKTLEQWSEALRPHSNAALCDLRGKENGTK
ncbi:MAG: hypothetical protein QM813_26295 [Verrucomicrobiota bacterium]